MEADAGSPDPPGRAASDGGGANIVDGAVRGSRAAQVANVVGLLLLLELVVLAATGAYLFVRYRPTAAQSWGELEAMFGRVPLEQRVRRWHRVTSTLTLWTAVALAAALVFRSSTRRRVHAVIAGIGTVAGIAAASYTGYLLAWDQLALWAITVGTNMAGSTWLWHDDVRFVLVNGMEISVRTFAVWTVVHLSLGVVLLGAITWFLHRRLARVRQRGAFTAE